MPDPSAATIQFTLTDVDVGCRLMEALVSHVRGSGAVPIGYADLLTLARGLHPRDAMLAREVTIGIGAKLAFVSACCRENGWPDLARLAVRTGATVPATSVDYTEAEAAAIAGFDWSGAVVPLQAYANDVRAAVPKRFKPRKERPADVAWYAYFCSHREACKWIGADEKKEIINLLMAGLDPESASRRVRAAKAEFAEPS